MQGGQCLDSQRGFWRRNSLFHSAVKGLSSSPVLQPTTVNEHFTSPERQVPKAPMELGL